MGSVADLWTLLIWAEQSLEVSWKGPASVAPRAPSCSDIKGLRAGKQEATGEGLGRGGWPLKARLDLEGWGMCSQGTQQLGPRRNGAGGAVHCGTRRKLATSGQGEVQWEGECLALDGRGARE